MYNDFFYLFFEVIFFRLFIVYSLSVLSNTHIIPSQREFKIFEEFLFLRFFQHINEKRSYVVEFIEKSFIKIDEIHENLNIFIEF